MNGVEHPGQLDPNCRQIIDVEKTAIIDFFCRDPPKRQPIRLRVQQRIQRIKAARIARISIDLRHCFFDRLLDLWLDDLLFTGAFRNSFRIRFGALRQILERGQNALQFRIKIFVLVVGEILQRDFENVTISTGRDRQPALAIEKIKRSLLETHLQFAALKHAPVLVAQNWQQNLVAQIRL